MFICFSLCASGLGLWCLKGVQFPALQPVGYGAGFISFRVFLVDDSYYRPVGDSECHHYCVSHPLVCACFGQGACWSFHSGIADTACKICHQSLSDSARVL